MAGRNVNGAQLEVVERGDGDPVVLVHGSASDYRTWQSQLDDLGDDYRVIAYSRRYHWPNAPIPDDADYSMREHVDDLAALLGSIDASPVHLIGHSYGAFVALLLALRAPGSVRTLVLAEPPVITLFVSNEPRAAEILRLLVTRPRSALAIMSFGATGLRPATVAARRGDMEEAMRTFGRAVLGAETYDGLSPARREQSNANAIRAEFLGSGFPSLDDDELGQMRAPTLLIGGQRSRPLFHRLLDRLEELLPRCERIEIPAASHNIHEDNAPAYTEAVRSFLSAHQGT
jgi:pimeloyl-ACP methyl ester carboxylesterase